jgi:hypothetical protein
VPDADDPTDTPRRRGKLGASVRRTEALTNRVIEGAVLPVWQRATSGEPRWPVSLAVIAAVVMQGLLPSQVQLTHPWLLPSVALFLVIAITVADPSRMTSESPILRFGTAALIAWITGANLLSAARLVNRLLTGNFHGSAERLLITGGAIWLTNVIAFALWYWHFDRGGPVDRAHGKAEYPDFLFPQMQDPSLAPPDWDTGFIDYMFVSFTNAAAFSPTDVLPLKRWAKLTMMTQSAISLMTVALVVARAVNVLPG